jgi:hypothetical protein
MKILGWIAVIGLTIVVYTQYKQQKQTKISKGK